MDGEGTAANHGPEVRVLLADDEEMSRLGLAAALDHIPGIVIVGVGRAGMEVRSSVRSCRPDVVLLNAASRDDWARTVRAILADQLGPKVPKVIVVTGAEIDDRVPQAVQAGADAVLLRSMSADELTYAVRQVANGNAVLSPAATRWVFSRLRTLSSAEHAWASETLIGMLSQREQEVLAGLVAGKSNQEIATDNHLALATVKSHVSSILTKLGVRDRVQAALVGQSAGIGL